MGARKLFFLMIMLGLFSPVARSSGTVAPPTELPDSDSDYFEEDEPELDDPETDRQDREFDERDEENREAYERELQERQELQELEEEEKKRELNARFEEQIDIQAIEEQLDRDESLFSNTDEREQALERLIELKKSDIKQQYQKEQNIEKQKETDPCEANPNSAQCLLQQSMFYFFKHRWPFWPVVSWVPPYAD